MNFYEWLQLQPEKYAIALEAFERFRIPKAANRLNVILRHTKRRFYPSFRWALKRAHREWRNYAPNEHFNFVEVAEIQNLEIPRLTSPDFDSAYLAGLKRGEDITFTANFQLSDEAADTLFVRLLDTVPVWLVKSVEGLPPVKSERWRRVYRRWGFKHRDKCAVCQRTNFFGTLADSVCARPDCILMHYTEVTR